ncbi:MAG: hypothetical protein KDC95_09680 [Planctomycetes bacterium]|nr:hypothetical protein [Planctomycetota bacterium]
MRDYYDHAPVRIPRTPIVVSGSAGSRYDAIARIVGGLTSLPLLTVPDLIVHATGKCAQRVRDEDGETALLRAFEESTQRALESTPFGLVVLPPEALTQDRIARMVRSAVLVAVRREFESDDPRVLAALDTAVLSMLAGAPDHAIALQIVRTLELDDERLR